MKTKPISWANSIATAAISMSCCLLILTWPAANAASQLAAKEQPRLPTIQGTYTPPPGIDWGCGKGNPVTVRADKSRICPIHPQTETMTKDEHIQAGHGALSLVATVNNWPAMRSVAWSIAGETVTLQHSAVIWKPAGKYTVCANGKHCRDVAVFPRQTSNVIVEIGGDK